jgi:hemoglobin
MKPYPLLLACAALILTTPVFAQEAAPAKPGALPLPPPQSVTAPVIATDDHLIKAFGGQDGLKAMTADFMINILADDRINIFFKGFDHAKIEKLLGEQFCQILNGGCVYSGRDMNIHAHMGITQADFNAIVEDLQVAMNKHKVPFWAQNKLLSALAPQSRDMVVKTPPAPVAVVQ